MTKRNGTGFTAGALIGGIGGLIGLGGAEFRLPVLIGYFRLTALDAVMFNKAMSLVVVMAAFVFRLKTIDAGQLADHSGIVLNLLAGSVIGAWWAAGRAVKMSGAWLNRIILILLIFLAAVMLSEAWLPLSAVTGALIPPGIAQMTAGVIAGFGIGIVAALLGVAGGELLIPTIVLLYGADIRVAGSLSLMVSLPTMIVGFARYSRSGALDVVRKEKSLFLWMVAGSVAGAAVGGLAVGYFPSDILTTLLGIILLISAVKTWQHTRETNHAR